MLTTFKLFENNGIDYLYHGTSNKNAKNIIMYGLSDNIYLGDISTANNYAYGYNEPVLIKFNINDIKDFLEPNYTLIDFYNDNYEEDDYGYIIDKWNNSDKDWLSSLDLFDSVILPISNINVNFDDIIYLY